MISLSENTFATVILQLPTAVGHRGGHLKVEYKGKEKFFENQENSYEMFYLSAYYGSCNHEMKFVTKGFKLTLRLQFGLGKYQQSNPSRFPRFPHCIERDSTSAHSLDQSTASKLSSKKQSQNQERRYTVLRFRRKISGK